MQSGIYMSYFGDIVEYTEGNEIAFDINSGNPISLEKVDFNQSVYSYNFGVDLKRS